jgi:hypothetical protein
MQYQHMLSRTRGGGGVMGEEVARHEGAGQNEACWPHWAEQEMLGRLGTTGARQGRQCHPSHVCLSRSRRSWSWSREEGVKTGGKHECWGKGSRGVSKQGFAALARAEAGRYL